MFVSLFTDVNREMKLQIFHFLCFVFFLRSEHYQDRIIKIRSNNARQHKSEKPLQRVLWNIKLEKDV